MTYTADGLLATTGTSAIPANPNPGATNGTPPAPSTGAGRLSIRYYDASGTLVGLVDGPGTEPQPSSAESQRTPPKPPHR
ncbi:MAG: hypothetical protein J0I04_13055 [Paenarthrobacter ureafaciens]|uniref:hypothetical protein n=1 Tax=Paenarthrobacter ureafaciens TaxID=37931 RepID=UPI001AD28235|nr:hypothetical protein [Paenarthrobacter ureafaciens]MBN9130559.1 hypothetical protein [Paenarthrobacter ureafaciens]